MSIFNGIKENDIVDIKFKDIKELYSNLDNLKELMDKHNLSYNIKAILHGGMFNVTEGIKQDNNGKYHITIDNHLDDSTITVFEGMVDSIKVTSDVPSFKSGEHGFNIVRLNNKLVINGVALINRDYDEEKALHKMFHSNRSPTADETKPDNDLKEFKEFIEQWLVDVSTEEAFAEDNKEDK